MGTEDDLAKALRLHEAGDLLAAGNLYRGILSADPGHVDALNLLGVIMHAAGDTELAIELIGRAVQLAPDYAAPLINLGNALQAAGRAGDAASKFERALELDPGAGAAASNLASALNDLGRYEDARRAGERAVTLAPDLPDAFVNLGNALLGLGRTEAALARYTAALERDPRHGAAWFNLGNAHGDAGNYKAALNPYRKAIQFNPQNADAHYNLANALQQLDAFEEAIASFQDALALEPRNVDAKCNLASAWQSLGETEKAIEILRDAIACERLTGDGESADLHWNLSLALLQNGDMAAGWREYEWRWRTPTFAAFKRDFDQPAWQGEDLKGRKVFIHAEQGFGDALQFVRYMPLVASKGGRVVLECRAELMRLFEGMAGVDACVALGDEAPEFAAHAPLMSLPRIFGTDIASTPCDVPYLSVPEAARADPRLGESEGFRVGVVWSGSPTRPDNHKRSCPLTEWTPVFEAPGVDFFALQVGAGREQLNVADRDVEVVDLAGGLADFADTAANVAALDLVISVDTSVLHLAGALGKPAFALLSQPTGFLWMNGRADSPWYPTMRLFRQERPGDWAPVLGQAAQALREMAP